MRILRIPLLAASLLTQLALAAVPTFTVVDTGLTATFGNAGKGIFDPQVAGFSGVAFGAGKFVALGASINGTTLNWATSTDGRTWTPHSQTITGGTTYQTSLVHFLNGKFIFFGGLGGTNSSTWVYSSTDGLTWTENKVLDNIRLNPGEFDASPTMLVAAGSNGRQVASSDLVTWVSRPVIPNGTGYDHLDLAYGLGHFYSSINGFGGTTYSSTDAETWTSLVKAAVIGGSRAESGNGIVIINAGNDRYRSLDGVTFAKITQTIGLAGWFPPGGDPRFTDGRFLATAVDLNTGKTAYVQSADAVTWTPVGYIPAAPAAPAGQNRSYLVRDVVIGNGMIVLAGTDRTATVSGDTTSPLIMVLDAPAAPVAALPPAITQQPAAVNGVLGGSVTLSVSASGATSYQWRKDGVALSGATGSSLTRSNLAATDAGTYSVVVSNANGSTTSGNAVLAIVSASNAGRIINMSIRSQAGSSDATLIVGASLGGANTSGTTAMLVRGVGPTLKTFGVGAALDDPSIQIYQGTSKIAENDDWTGSFTFSSVGAFGFSSNPVRDAAYYASSINGGTYSVQVTGKNNATGIALAELYDVTPGAEYTATRPRLINVSARTAVGAGEYVLIAGFSLGGSTPVKLLIRGVGPTLSAFSVGGVLANPKLQVFDAKSVKIAENDDWSGTAELKAAFNSAGAFGLASDTSKDAALIVTLQPGTYSTQVSGVNDATGIALVEVYELP